jgi:hypothetical protein
MRKLRRFFALSGQQRWLLLKTLSLLATVRLGLWVLPFRIVLRLTETLRRKGLYRLDTPSDSSVSEVVWAVKAASRYVPKATCLTQSLTAYCLLGRLGHLAKLEIGVARGKEGTLDAHAWVEVDGETLIGSLPDLSRFSKFPPLDAKMQGF